MINASNGVINRYNKNAKVYLKKWILQNDLTTIWY